MKTDGVCNPQIADSKKNGKLAARSMNALLQQREHYLFTRLKCKQQIVELIMRTCIGGKFI